MWDKFLDWLDKKGDNLKFWWVVDQYNKGVLLRWGKFVRVLEPGFHCKWPIADDVLEQMVVVTTVNLSEQTITTLDNRQLVVRAVIKYEVAEVEKFLLEVNDAVDALSDMSKGIIRDQVKKRKWSECNGDELESEINDSIKKEAKKWGLTVKKVTLTDLGEIPSFRLFNSSFIQT